jgi:hypothetical protein
VNEEFAGLRLAAKATDREHVAQLQWPGFEARLSELGYGPRAIAHAFSTLSGPGTVAEALQVLKHRPSGSPPVAMSFEVRFPPGNLPVESGLIVRSVERDDDGIRVDYDYVMAPALSAAPLDSCEPRGEGKDDLGNVYRALGGHFGLIAGDKVDGRRVRASGRFTLPLPVPEATELRIRITPNTTVPSIWETPSREVRVSLAH